MITKNESANLGPCLDSLQNLARQTIVVDTGSTDDTVAIALAHGAEVHHFPWIGDFAAARNEALSYAKCKWVFWLDADDRLSPEAVAQTKAAVASGLADAFSYHVVSRIPEGGDDITTHVRLFRNGRGVRFHGAVHESVASDLKRLGLRVASTELRVEHTGYLNQEARLAKSRRNLALLDDLLAKEPDNTDYLFYRGQARALLGHQEGMAQDLKAVLQRSRPTPKFNLARFWSYASLTTTLKSPQLAGELNQLLADALVEFPQHPYLLAMQGRALVSQGRPADAIPVLLNALEQNQPNVLGVRPPDAWLESSLCDAYVALGRKDEAIGWIARAVAHDPGKPAYALGLAELAVDLGRLEEAGQVLSQLPAAADEGPAPWVLRAEVWHRQGRWNEAVQALANAQARGLPQQKANVLAARLQAGRVLLSTATSPPSSSGLREVQLQGLSALTRGEHQRAAELFARAIEVAPADSDNYRYLAVAMHNLGLQDQAREAWRQAQQVETSGSR
jgi:tetratricopeptide (TPR) repeat protein